MGDLVMVEQPYGFASGIDGGPSVSEIRYQYFVFGRDSLFGLEYDSGDPAAGPKRLPVEKASLMLIPEWPRATFFIPGVTRMVSSVRDGGAKGAGARDAGVRGAGVRGAGAKDAGVRGAGPESLGGPGGGPGGLSGLVRLREAYCGLAVDSTRGTSDTCYLTYSSGFKGLPAGISLSHEMDSLRQMKLCEVRLVVGPHFEKKENRRLGRCEIVWKLEELTSFDRDSAQHYFSRYRADRGSAGKSGE
jgi:hypothetical protein